MRLYKHESGVLVLCLLVLNLFWGCASQPLVLDRQDPSELQLLREELETEKQKVKELASALQSLHPIGTGQVLPLIELFAVPEEYVGKDVVFEGKLGSPAQIRDPVSCFFVRQPDIAGMGISCCFRTQDLDPDSRRLLLATKDDEPLRISGRLSKISPEGLAGKAGVIPYSGYEFHVTRVSK